MTAFIHDRVDLGNGITVVIDGNSKITAGNGTYANPTPNAFSLPAASVESERGPIVPAGTATNPGGSACPGSTPTCRASCYVRGLAKHAPDVYAAYSENAAALMRIFDSPTEISYETADALGAWIERNARGGFRWHVSGDVWNWEHALWIKNVCRQSRGVQHWIYTRTLEVVDILMAAPNLAVNVSADRDNAADAIACAWRHGARVAYMATEGEVFKDGALRDGDVVFPDYPLRGRGLPEPTLHAYWQNAPHRLRVMVCPADFWGQSEEHRCGPCSKCMKPTRAAT